jgi:hypothetical protein
MKKVLIACEYSGKIRDQFIKQGHDAMSCDLLPSESKGPHYQGSVLDILDDTWDLMIAHPPCTYLCNSGVRWLFEQEGRWAKLDEAVEFFLTLKNAPIKQIAIENPIPHKYARKHIGGYTQLIQPWQFGHGETKATCFWLQGLSNLEPTNIVDGRESRIHKMSPSKNRSKHRSETYSGIAKAIAEQWG